MQLENEYTFRSTSMPSKCFERFADFKSQKKFCDVTFTAGTQNISAHRIVVAAAIPFFQETLDAGKDEIRMPEIDPAIFECLVDFAYSCELQITMENVRDLLSGACQLQMGEVRDACCDFLAERLSPENAMNFRELAVGLHYAQLIEVIDDYIKEYFTEIYETEEFLSSPFSYIKELIGKEDLQVNSEETALEAVLKWVRASPDDRKMNLPDLLCQVRMTLITPLYLTELVKREELIRTSIVNRDLVDEARNYNMFPQSRSSVCSFPTEPRRFTKADDESNQNDSAGICKLTIQTNYTAQYFDFTQNKWVTKESRQYYLSGVSSVALNHKMYIFRCSDAVLYDPANNEYELLQQPSVPRVLSGAASLKNKIYVCGGSTDLRSTSNVVECFDPVTKRWTEVKPMRLARRGFAAVGLGDHIYVLGGQDQFHTYNSVERYPSVTRGWTTMAPMLTKRSNHGACALNRKIYVCGGYVTTSYSSFVASVEVYDPITDKWEFIAPMNTARYNFVLVSYHGKLHAVGGKDENAKLLYTTEIYDPQDDKWTPGSPLDRNYYISAAVVM